MICFCVCFLLFFLLFSSFLLFFVRCSVHVHVHVRTYKCVKSDDFFLDGQLNKKIKKKHTMNRSAIAEVDTNLFLGSKESTNVDMLAELNIQNVFHIGFVPATKMPSIQYHFFDLEDNGESVDAMLDIGMSIVPKIKECLERGEKTLVCCLMGRSRSASMMVMCLHDKYPDMSYRDIVAKIKKVRSISINQTFADKLERFVDFSLRS